MISLFQFIIIIAGFLFLLFAIDAYHRKKLNFLHFSIFLWWWGLVMSFGYNNNLLNSFWKFFWIASWSSLIVYLSIIFLFYLFFDILNKLNKNKYNISRMITYNTINKLLNKEELNKLENKKEFDNFLFLIRSYNESQTIGNVIDEIIKKWFNKILVINDWSKDNTEDIIKEMKEKYEKANIIVLTHDFNRGWWAANKTWFEFIKKHKEKLNIEWVVTYDADWQMNINDMDNFIKNIKKDKIDIYLWSRFIKWWNAFNIPKIRRIILFWAKIVTFVLNGLWLSDPHNWYRVINIECIDKIKIYSDKMTYASEMLDSIRKNKLSYKEIPVNIKYTDYSKLKWQKNLNAFNILFEIIYKKLFFR